MSCQAHKMVFKLHTQFQLNGNPLSKVDPSKNTEEQLVHIYYSFPAASLCFHNQAKKTEIKHIVNRAFTIVEKDTAVDSVFIHSVL